MKNYAKRISGLDIFRGVAILLMVTYHFIYDLNHFNLITIEINQNPLLLIFRYIIMSMFILGVGMSLVLVHQHAVNWKSLRKRLIQLGLAAIAVSISTYIVFPDSWVYFGILHFILLSSFLVLPLIKLPKITLFLAVVIFIGSSTHYFHLHDLFALLKEPLCLPSPSSQDLVPLFPWLTPLLTGMLIVQYKLHEKIFNHKIFNINFSINKILKKMGQNSLIIYLIHQPILFLSFDLYFRFFSK
ncbi:MAG: Unknown protein [uncultured Sulfurovum sp.]|uniref:Heparan-alpha-glucosaminide N-acetyltransferase catalytic domain-containing protein n=1 Tax=uncultured Sulfurovum sp. TaxID=269237 RepID=A0A6S6T061_9BACT|nr:MAG: Unknown protein [uncultured Sulfurovum sp.]